MENNIKIKESEIESMIFLITRAKIANSFIKASQNTNIINAAKKLFSDTKILMKEWWEKIAEKYNIDIKTDVYYINFNTYELYKKH